MVCKLHMLLPISSNVGDASHQASPPRLLQSFVYASSSLPGLLSCQTHRIYEYASANAGGCNTTAAEKKGWVTKRAEGRRRRKEAKKASEAAKWAKYQSDWEYVRKERKKLGLPVEDETPTPSEAAYRERVAEAGRQDRAERLRNRVQRASYQLLIAAALGKQYRELTTADHTGHVVPGADRAVPLRHRPFDARSEGGLSQTEAMARAVRNWASRENEYRVRGRSTTPSTVVAPSRTTGPEDSPSGSSSDSPFTESDSSDDGNASSSSNTSFSGGDDGGDNTGGKNMPAVNNNSKKGSRKAATKAGVGKGGKASKTKSKGGRKVAGGLALRATAYQPETSEDDDTDLSTDDDEDDLSGLANLDPEDVSDEVLAAAYAMMAVTPQGGEDWIDLIAHDILKGLFDEPNQLTPPKSPSPNRNKGRNYPNTQHQLPDDVKAALEFLKTPDPSPSKKTQAHPCSLGPDCEKYDNGKGPSAQKPNKPPRPSPGVYDPRRWKINKDAHDSIWVREALKRGGQKQPEDRMETGFVTWDEQEARFPHLDQRLHLEDVSGPYPNIFDPATVDTRVWDPFNRVIAEPKTGKRAALRLNPITTHSLARWIPSELGREPSTDPVRLPDNPLTEDKKRPLPSATLTMPRRKARKVGTGKKKVTWAGQAKVAVPVPTKETPSRFTSQSAPVASVHYPLKSPTVTSINGAGRTSLAIAVSKPNPPGPPTPYPRQMTVPETPTVALYEHPTFIAEEEAMSSIAEVQETGEAKAGAFLWNLDYRSPIQSTFSPTASSLFSGQNDNKKRPAQVDLTGSSSIEKPAKKRRTSFTEDDIDYSSSGSSITTGSSDSENENVATLRTPITIQMHPDTWISQESSSQDIDVLESTSDSASYTTSKAQASTEGLGMDLEIGAGEYDEEELQTAHPVLMREYYSARADLARTNKVDADYARAAERFDRAKSQLKAALNEESAAKSAEAWDAAALQDAFEAEMKKGLWEQQQPASALSGLSGPANPYHPHHSAQPRLDPNKVVKKYGGKFPPKPKVSDQQQRLGPKSVRFKLQGEGPSDVMRHEARRAVGRYGLTSMRRGSLGPYR
ncbi:hypothetical protein HD806DRAFT_322226 [Xylariaceae sp. AK1471]|nr:hypothetical protein HD806DRAFT_322226 [Xylariaceae sp. AK1471]